MPLYKPTGCPCLITVLSSGHLVSKRNKERKRVHRQETNMTGGLARQKRRWTREDMRELTTTTTDIEKVNWTLLFALFHNKRGCLWCINLLELTATRYWVKNIYQDAKRDQTLLCVMRTSTILYYTLIFQTQAINFPMLRSISQPLTKWLKRNFPSEQVIPLGDSL